MVITSLDAKRPQGGVSVAHPHVMDTPLGQKGLAKGIDMAE